MTIWFIQWTEKEVKEFLGKRDFMMDCIGNGNKNFVNRATPKDIVWIHAIVEGKHKLLGTMELGTEYNREETERIIGRSLATVKYDSYWINTLDWIPIQTVDMDEDFVRGLNFLPIDRLPEGYKSTQKLRVPKELSPLDHRKLSDFWMQRLVSDGILDEDGNYIGDVEESNYNPPPSVQLDYDDDDDWDDWDYGSGSGGRTPNDDRSDSMNPNSPRYNPGR